MPNEPGQTSNPDPSAQPSQPAAGQPPAAPENAPSPPANQPAVPATLPAQPAQPVAQPLQSADADRNELYSWTDPDGKQKVMTLGQMVAEINQKQIPEEVRKNAELLLKAQTGDKTAILEMLGANKEAVEDTPTSVNPDQITALQQELNEVKAVLGNVKPVAEQVVQLRDSATIGRLIEDCKEQLPFCARNPQAPGMVLQQRNVILAQLQQGGVNTNQLTPDQLKNVMTQAFTTVENYLKTMLACYGVTPESIGQASKAQQVVAQDDQSHGSEGVVPAKLRVEGGKLMVDGQQMQQVAGAGLVPVPTDVPNPASGGGAALSPGTASAQSGPTNRRGLVEQLRARTSEMTGGQQ